MFLSRILGDSIQIHQDPRRFLRIVLRILVRFISVLTGFFKDVYGFYLRIFNNPVRSYSDLLGFF